MIRARAALRLGRHAQALRALRRLERQLPHLADFVYFLRGSALMGLERLRASRARVREGRADEGIALGRRRA
jgi:uncharacterized membrane protein SirB2